MVRSWISGEGEVWMNMDVRELSFNETEKEAGSPFDGPVVDVQLKDQDDLPDDKDDFDDKDSDELEEDDIKEEELDIEEVEDFEDDELLDEENDDIDDVEEDEF